MEHLGQMLVGLYRMNMLASPPCIYAYFLQHLGNDHFSWVLGSINLTCHGPSSLLSHWFFYLYKSSCATNSRFAPERFWDFYPIDQVPPVFTIPQCCFNKLTAWSSCRSLIPLYQQQHPRKHSMIGKFVMNSSSFGAYHHTTFTTTDL